MINNLRCGLWIVIGGIATACGSPDESSSDGVPAVCPEVDTSSDPTSCGACGNRCAPVVLAVGQSSSGLALDATSAYWAGDGLVRVPLDGSIPLTLASDLEWFPTALAVDATSVYWTSGVGTGVNDVGNGAVMKVPLDGGTATTLASGLRFPGSIAVDATSVYWANGDQTGNGELMKIPLDGGVPTTLAAGQFNGTNIALDATSVYWADYATGAVMSVPLDGGPSTTLATGHVVQALAIDATHVYWTSNLYEDPNGYGYDDCTIMSVPLAGGTQVTLYEDPSKKTQTVNFWGIAVDSTFVYWSRWDDVTKSGSVMRVPLTGGSPTVVASNQFPVAIALDATSVYWTNFEYDVSTGTGTGSILRFDKQACQGGLCQ